MRALRPRSKGWAFVSISATCAACAAVAPLDGLTGGGSGGDASADAGGAGRPAPEDANAGGETSADGGSDAGLAPDDDADAASIADSEPPLDVADARDASEEAGVEAGPVEPFGPSCAAGTIYTDPFTTDPIASGTWTVITGPVTYDAAHHLLQLGTGNPNTQAWIGARPAWTAYTISAQVRIDTPDGNGGVNFRMSNPGTANDSGQMYYAGIAPTFVQLGIENDGYTNLAQSSATFSTGTFYTLTVTANGSSLSVAVNGTTYVDATDATFAAGSIGLRTFSSGMTYGTVSVTCGP